MPLLKRIIPCLDVDHGRTVKGIKFQGLVDIGCPIELAKRYQDEGADELVFLDISASHEGRENLYHVVERVAEVLMIPFTVGGGIASVEQVAKLLNCGADKVSINSAAVKTPQLIQEIAEQFGSQCCVLAIDAKLWPEHPGKWQVLTHGGRTQRGIDALEWVKKAYTLGAGEILLTSWDRDGTRLGFDIPMLKAFAQAVNIPVIASGGASDMQSFVDVFSETQVDAALAASIFHHQECTIGQLKHQLKEANVLVRVTV